MKEVVGNMLGGLLGGLVAVACLLVFVALEDWWLLRRPRGH